MPRKGGWRRLGSRRRFRYVDARGDAIEDEEKLERIRALVIPPAWKDVWISPSPGAKLQATGVDAVGRRQYLYHATFRAQQEQAKFDRLIRLAERLPDLRAATAEHLDNETLDRLRVSAIATERLEFDFVSKHRTVVRTTLLDDELAAQVDELLELPGGRRLFRYIWQGGACSLTGSRLNDYVREHLGEEFTAKDFRTWGGTLVAAIALAEHGPAGQRTRSKKG